MKSYADVAGETGILGDAASKPYETRRQSRTRGRRTEILRERDVAVRVKVDVGSWTEADGDKGQLQPTAIWNTHYPLHLIDLWLRHPGELGPAPLAVTAGSVSPSINSSRDARSPDVANFASATGLTVG